MDRIAQLGKAIREHKKNIVTPEKEREIILNVAKRISNGEDVKWSECGMTRYMLAYCLVEGLPLGKLLELFPEWDGKEGYFE